MNEAPSRSVSLFGTEEAVEPPRHLAAGPLTAELEAGNLRYIRFDGMEMLRAVSFIVRDKNWGTYNPTITGLKIVEGDGAFRVSYDAVTGDAVHGGAEYLTPSDIDVLRVQPGEWLATAQDVEEGAQRTGECGQDDESPLENLRLRRIAPDVNRDEKPRRHREDPPQDHRAGQHAHSLRDRAARSQRSDVLHRKSRAAPRLVGQSAGFQ